MALRTGHVGINVTDLGRSKAFYLELFKLEELAESTEDGRRFAFLVLGNPVTESDDFLAKLAITLWEQGCGTFSPQAPGLHHLTFHVASVEEVERVRDDVKRLGADAVRRRGRAAQRGL